MTETALHGRVSEFGRARGRAFLKMAGHRPCFVYAWIYKIEKRFQYSDVCDRLTGWD